MKQPKETTSYGLPARLGVFLACFALTFGLTVTGIMCLVTAFHLPIDLWALLGCLALGSLGACLLYGFRRGWLLVLAAWVLGLGAVWLWGLEPLGESGKLVYDTLFTVYARAYQITGGPSWAPAPWAGATQALILWGLVAACVVAWTLMHRQSLAAAVLFSILPLVLCLVVVDTPPAVSWLLAFLALECIMFLTQGCRRRSPRQGARLTLFLAVPLAALLLGLYALLPQENYVRSPLGQKILQSMVDFSSKFISLDAELLGDLNALVPVSRMESLEVGPRKDTDDVILRVQASTTGNMYLRGLTYGVYTGTAWEQIPAGAYPEESSRPGLANGGDFDYRFDQQTVNIRSTVDRSVIYTPYYLQRLPEVGDPLRDCGVENTERLRSYSVTYARSVFLSDPEDEAVRAYQDFVHEYYTQLPEETRANALAIAERWSARRVAASDLPEYLAQQVSRSAKYDLNTPRMPRGSDFAIWFLEESDTGYCVHYATAVVVMLRAMDIPARYVTGYVCQTSSGVWRPVTGKNAHAWAEYYVDGVGWLPLEATPAGGVEDTVHPTTAPPETTTEPEREITHTLADPNQTTSPRETREPEQEEARLHLVIPGWLWWVLGLLALAILRRPATLALARPRGKRSNRRFLSQWKRTRRLARALKRPEECRDLALKARFSQHRLSHEEWDILCRWQQDVLEALKAAPWPKKLLLRWLLILDAGLEPPAPRT